MSMTHQAIDAQRLGLILNDLRLPAIKLIWPDFADRADKEGWPGARLIAALAEHEIAERDRRRIERHLSEARLPPGQNARQLCVRRRADDQPRAGHGAMFR